MTNEMRELAEAGLRHAEGLTAQLSKQDWQPRRSHVEQARNSIKKLADVLRAQSDVRAAAPQGEPVGYGYSAEIQSGPGRLLHVCRDREGLYDTPLYAASPAADEIASLRAQLASAREYVDRAIASYNGDPADNNFQKGFLAALEIVREEAFPLTDEKGDSK